MSSKSTKNAGTNKNSIDLGEQIKLHIKTEGPMSLATYMRLCLTHPNEGYYKISNPIGTGGDFITAPEISQMFGEMLGAWVLLQWNFLGRPHQFNLVELGPGRGTLMNDIMRMVATDKSALAASAITLLETSDTLRKVQRKNLKNYQVSWINEIGQLDASKRPIIMLANEFFDALPIKQYQWQNSNWHERLIGLKDEKLVWGLSPSPPEQNIIDDLNSSIKDIPLTEGEIKEVSPLGNMAIAQIARLLNLFGGSALIIDYGYEISATGDTFQAVKNHTFCDPLENCGQADLSSHVDFQNLINIARQNVTEANFLGTQGQILQQLGIKKRAQKIIAANPDKKTSISADLSRLIDTDKMGDLFKAMQIYSPTPAPFEQLENFKNLPNINHGFFGRSGGCSPAPFDSLNVSLLTKDPKENIIYNRNIVAKSMGIPLNRLVILHQIHSADVIIVEENFDFASSQKADAMVTSMPGTALGILIADCTPVLFADAKTGIIGACHAGWQGALKGVIANTLLAMEELGAKRNDIIAAIGPTIWQENYEVGDDFATDFILKHPEAEKFFAFPLGKVRQHFDLPGFIRNELEQNGINNIEQTGECTYTHPDKYFSHRYATHKNSDTGRQIALISLNP